MKTKVMKEILVEDKGKNNDSYMKYKNEDDNNQDFNSVKYKGKKRPSEATEETKKGKNKSRRILTNV